MRSRAAWSQFLYPIREFKDLAPGSVQGNEYLIPGCTALLRLPVELVAATRGVGWNAALISKSYAVLGLVVVLLTLSGGNNRPNNHCGDDQQNQQH